MALREDWGQQLLSYEVTLAPVDDGHGSSESGSVGRMLCDGVLIVYDLEDEPRWLLALKDRQDDDGNVERQAATA